MMMIIIIIIMVSMKLTMVMIIQSLTQRFKPLPNDRRHQFAPFDQEGLV